MLKCSGRNDRPQRESGGTPKEVRTLERFWKETFARKLEEMENDPKIRLLKQYPQHDGNNTFQHCHNVAVYSFYLEMRLQWEIDVESLVMGAMLTGNLSNIVLDYVFVVLLNVLLPQGLIGF